MNVHPPSSGARPSPLLRLLDIGLSVGGLVVSAPVVGVLLVVIALDSPGGPILAQTRVGRNERLFTCYKLRTMRVGSATVGSHEISVALITRVGHTLRRLKLDELPQLVNVIRGDMSLVGPRPCLPNQHDVIAARRTTGVFSVRPGITGAAQMAGIDMSTPEQLAQADRANLNLEIPAYISAIVRTALGSGRGDRTRPAA